MSRPDETIHAGGVSIFGPTNLPATAPLHASQMYSNNLVSFLSLIAKDGKLAIDTDDEIVRETMVTRDGQITNPAHSTTAGYAIETRQPDCRPALSVSQ